MPSHSADVFALQNDGSVLATVDTTYSAKQSASEPYQVASYPYVEFYYNLLGQDIGNSNFGAAVGDLQNLAQYTGDTYTGFIQDLQNTPLNTGNIYADLYNLHIFPRLCDSTTNTVSKLHLLRVGSDGSSSDVVAYQWSSSDSKVWTLSGSSPNYTATATETGTGPPAASWNAPGANGITNADQGAVFSWQTAGYTDGCVVTQEVLWGSNTCLTTVSLATT
jgi:hypothetical protein